MTDANGATDTQTVTITITGTNDAPVISSEAGAGAVTEAGLAEDDATAVTGPRRRPGRSPPPMSMTARRRRSSGRLPADNLWRDDDQRGDGGWLYTLDNDLAATQALNEGDTVTQTYTATVTDANGATDTQTCHDHHHGHQ